MRHDPVFHNLLVSAPNGGGLFAIHHGQVELIDRHSTTGLGYAQGRFYRALQPSTLACYSLDTALFYQHDFPGLADLHDVKPFDDGCLAVITYDNAVVAMDHHGRVLRRWALPGEPDSSHINSLACWSGRVVYSVFGDFSQHRGYKQGTRDLGSVRELDNGCLRIGGLSQPHSLTPHGDGLLLADSERMRLVLYDATGRQVREAVFDAYTRGIAVRSGIVYLGLSSSRNITQAGEATASVVALAQESWSIIARLSLPVREIYDILALPDDATAAALRQTILHTQLEMPADHAAPQPCTAPAPDSAAPGSAHSVPPHDQHARNTDPA